MSAEADGKFASEGERRARSKKRPFTCASRKFRATHGGSHSSKRTAKVERLAALLESGEPNSLMRTCARALFGQEISNAEDGQRAAWLDSGSFRRPVVRSGGAVRRRGVALRRTPFRAGESLVAPVSPSPTKDAFSIGDSNRNRK
jgi:hypothetical protein